MPVNIDNCHNLSDNEDETRPLNTIIVDMEDNWNVGITIMF